MKQRRVVRQALVFLGAMGLVATSGQASAKNPRVIQIAPSSEGLAISVSVALTTVGNQALFVASKDPSGWALFTSDGTAANTRAFAAIRSDRPAAPNVLTSDGTTAIVQDAKNSDLWRTRGTFRSTWFLEPTNGPIDAAHSLDNGIFVLNLGLSAGNRLFRSDGTRAGTGVLAGGFSQLSAFQDSIVSNHTLIYPDITRGLMSTDGTTVTELLTTEDGKQTTALASCGGVLYATAGTSLLRIDGRKATNLGTACVYPAFQCAGSRVVFCGVGSTGTRGVWASDGTAGGTVPLTGNVAGDSSYDNLNTFSITNAGDGRVFFVASEPGTGLEPWITDGTRAGTTRIGDLEPGSASSLPQPLGIVGSTFYFVARNDTSLYSVARGSTAAKLVASSLGTLAPRVTTYNTIAGTKIFARAGQAGEHLWVFDTAAPVDKGDGAIEVAPFVAPPEADRSGPENLDDDVPPVNDDDPSNDAGAGNEKPGDDHDADEDDSSTPTSGASNDNGCAAAPGRAPFATTFIALGLALAGLRRRARMQR